MNEAQKTVLWIGLILVTLNFIIGGWTTWKKILFTGPSKAPSVPTIPGLPGLPLLPILPVIPSLPGVSSNAAPAATPAKNVVQNA